MITKEIEQRVLDNAGTKSNRIASSGIEAFSITSRVEVDLKPLVRNAFHEQIPIAMFHDYATSKKKINET